MIHVGDVFGRWTVIGDAPRWKYQRRFRCICSCGITRDVFSFSLNDGTSRSCGCLHREIVAERTRERATIHGAARVGLRAVEYKIWCGIIDRCTRPGNKSFKNYGGRGISICPEWRSSFPAFLAHIGRRPGPQYSVDRIDNERGYEPGNVRWATRAEQLRNRRAPVPRLLLTAGEA